jgi:DNA polymerase III delta prime subunit
MSNEFLWVEKYRPKTISECILTDEMKNTFEAILKTGELPNMMFSGSAGTGKTTVAKALCDELNLDCIVVNGSEEGNIDTLRGKIKQFASSVSLQGGYKVVILDEADYLNPQSTQPALRGFIEEFSNNCRFILTCNFKNRIIEPLHSRCSVYEFAIPKDQKATIAHKFFVRLQSILKDENVEAEQAVVAGLINKHFPDFRRVLGECQRYSVSGKIEASSVTLIQDQTELTNHLKNKDFKKMRSWVANNIDVEPQQIFRMIYDNMATMAKPHSIPQLVLILADYQYKNAFVADHELNMVACMTELMANVEFA